jgi:O-antigen ligase
MSLIKKILLINNLKFYHIVCLIVPGLVLGPFIPDFICVVISFVYIFLCIKNKKVFFFNKKIFIFFFTFYLYIILGSLLSVYPSLSLGASLFYIRFIIFALGLALIFSKDFSILKFFLFISVITIMFVSIDLIFQYFIGKNLFGMVTDDDHNRFSGLFGNELIVGSFISRLLFLGLIFYFIYLDLKKNSSKILLLIYLSITTAAVYFSGERTAFAIIILNLFLLLLSVTRIRKLLFLFFFIVILSSSFLFILKPDSKNRMINQTREQIFENNKINIFTKHYQSHYIIAFRMFKDQPIFGHGVKTFRKICENPKYYYENGCATHPHNFYFQILAETGLIGLFFLIIFYLYILKYYFSLVFKKIKNNSDFIKIILCNAIIINYFPFQPSGNFFNNWLNVVLFLPIALLIFFQFNKMIFFKKFMKIS